MTRRIRTLIGCSVLGSAILAAPLAALETQQAAGTERDRSAAADPNGGTMQHSYLGMWATGDGHISQELLANGRYDEARGSRKSAYQGRYEVRGITSTTGTIRASQPTGPL